MFSVLSDVKNDGTVELLIISASILEAEGSRGFSHVLIDRCGPRQKFVIMENVIEEDGEDGYLCLSEIAHEAQREIIKEFQTIPNV